jgi:hypothetical protein
LRTGPSGISSPSLSAVILHAYSSARTHDVGAGCEVDNPRTSPRTRAGARGGTGRWGWGSSSTGAQLRAAEGQHHRARVVSDPFRRILVRVAGQDRVVIALRTMQA